MIDAVKAVRRLLRDDPTFGPLVGRPTPNGEVRDVYGSPPGLPASVPKTPAPVAVVLQQTGINQDTDTPRDMHRIQFRVYGKDPNQSADLWRALHAVLYPDYGAGYGPVPIMNKVIANTWFLFKVRSYGDGGNTVLEPTTNWPVTTGTYEFTFDSLRGA